MGSLLKRRRHDVISRLPLVAVVSNLAEPFVKGRLLAVLAGPGNRIDDIAGGNHTDCEVDTSLYHKISA